MIKLIVQNLITFWTYNSFYLIFIDSLKHIYSNTKLLLLQTSENIKLDEFMLKLEKCPLIKRINRYVILCFFIFI